MKKIIKFNLIALLALVFFVSSCDDEDNTGYSELIKTNPTITVTGIQGAGYSFTETDSIFKYNVTLSEAQIVDIALYVTQIDGNATAGEDYVILNTNSRVYIPANSTSGVLEIQINADVEKEIEETFTLQIGDERTANAEFTTETVTFTLQNWKDEELSIELYWEVDIDLGFGVYSTSNNTDFDFGISPAATFDVNDVWADEVGIYTAATGSHPEVLRFVEGTLPDGDYVIWYDLYSNAFAGYGILTPVPVTAVCLRAGAGIDVTINQDPSSILLADEDVPKSGVVMLLTIAGDVFTVSDYTGEVLGSGKSASERTPRPSHLMK